MATPHDGCDLHIPHLPLPSNDPKFHDENNHAIEQWATHFYRNCSTGGGENMVIFSHPGTLSATLSPPYRPRSNFGLSESLITLTTAGTTATTLRAYRNSVSIGDVVLAAGVDEVDVTDITAEFEGRVDRLDWEIISLGDSAANLTIQCYGS